MKHLLLLLFGLHALGSNAISVELTMVMPDYCMDDPFHAPSGVLEATVTGGVAPFQFDWYDMDSGSPVLLCTDCGPIKDGLTGLRLYKVIVTDATSATAEHTLGPQGIVGPQVQFQTLAYEAGTQPVLIAEIYNDMENSVPGTTPTIDAMTPQPTHTYGPWDGLQSLYKSVLPVGTTNGTLTVSTSDGIGTCQAHFNYTIAPPSVLPTMEVLSVEGSCAAIGTGSATVRLSDGVLSSPLSMVIKDAAGQQVSFNGQYSVGPQPDVQTITALGPGDYWLVVTGDMQVSTTQIAGFTYTCRDSIPFTIPNLGPTCGVLRGTVFLDNNLNCTKQANEPGVPGIVVEVLPGPLYATTNAQGEYLMVLPTGNYTVQEQSAEVDEQCIEAPIPVAINGGATVTVDHATAAMVPLDAGVSLGSGAARPGFELLYAIAVRNYTVANTGTVTVQLQLDPVLGFLSAAPAPTTVSGQTLTWVLPAMPVFQQRTITIRTQVPPNVALLGTNLTSTASLTTALTDGNLANNTSANVRTVTGSYDPNDKLARTSGGRTTYLDPGMDTWVDYTIRFQNTGTDTAFHVWITDTLAATLDPATLRMGAASHPCTWELDGTGVLSVRFAHIRLPDSTVNEPRSHGFVTFRIQPVQPVVLGSSLVNTANIFFDFNPPVITPPNILPVMVPGVLVRPKVLLGGVAGASTGTMSDALRNGGLLPAMDPYPELGYTHVNGPAGSLSPGVLGLAGNNAIVDHVVVELRSSANAATRLATRHALLQRDGDVVGLDGTSPVMFAAPNGNYFVAVRHRNHLGVMTATVRTLNTVTATTVDFTLPATATWGTNAQFAIGGRMLLWPGDGDFNGTVKYTGTGNDRDPILQAIGGAVPTATTTNVYDPLDVNLDGTLKYTGLGNDRDPILQTIGGTIPTAVRYQQLP